MPVDVKICGLKTAWHAGLAARFGARWTGFIFFPKSPRNITLSEARALRKDLPMGPERVGVFVDADDDLIDAAIDALDLDIIQLHGKETPERVAELKSRLDIGLIKAIGVSDATDIEAASAYAPYTDAILFDAKPPKTADALPGGNAVSFPWHIMRENPPAYPWLLAGGLTPENLAAAAAASGATALDVSSGVEDAPGKKSAQKIEAFLKAAKAAR